MPANRDVLLAFPHPGTVRTEFMMSVFDQAGNSGTRVASVLAYATGPVLSKARNEIARKFLATEFEYLWMVDTDITFSPKTLPALLEQIHEDTPVVSALYEGRFDGVDVPIAYGMGTDSEGRLKFGMLRPEQITGAEGKVTQVAATGAGCLLIHRSAFDAISKHTPGDEGLWFCEMVVDGCEFGEDMSFCMRLALAGVPVILHTGVRVAHTKSLVIGEVTP